MASDKNFYIESFGCQMNAHNPEKVSGRLLHEGYTISRYRQKAFAN
jgi:tRNA-2-methylthio-N6-dimethylallyladenosine synthase